MTDKLNSVGQWQQWPADEALLRSGIYQGQLYKKPATRASMKATDDALNMLEHEFATIDVRHAWQNVSADDFFAAIGRIRKRLFMESEYRRNVVDVIEAMGLNPEEIAFEPFRLRVIQHQGHQDPNAKAVYYPHRDTWYAHPQCLMVGWLPLHDLTEQETFEVYPYWWHREVSNDSDVFDYSHWVRDGWQLKIGWQQQKSGATARYPGTTESVEFGERVGFDCKAADNVLFSGGHFHKTLEQATGKTRFSLDFRMVHLNDLKAGRGAPGIDTRCKGSAVIDYLHPPHLREPK